MGQKSTPAGEKQHRLGLVACLAILDLVSVAWAIIAIVDSFSA